MRRLRPSGTETPQIGNGKFDVMPVRRRLQAAFDDQSQSVGIEMSPRIDQQTDVAAGVADVALQKDRRSVGSQVAGNVSVGAAEAHLQVRNFG